MLFESPNAKLFPFNIPPPVRLSGVGVPGAELESPRAELSHQILAAHGIPHQAHQPALATSLTMAPIPQQPQINMKCPSPPRSPATSPSAVAGSCCKLFVGGLSWQTSSERLRDYFTSFGPVADVLIMKDPLTQRSRGFGFITFQDAASVDKVLAVPLHTLDGKRIDPKHATPKCAPRPNRTKKIFVGGVGQDTSAEEVRAYFAHFGPVDDAVMLMDQQTKRHRGFGFVTFHAEDAVERVCDIHFHTIKNKKVECKRAQPKEAVAASPLVAPNKRLVVRPGRSVVYGGVVAPAFRYAPYAVPAPQPAPAMPQFGAAYSLAGVDMSSFQGVDWGAMYGLPMYI